MRLLRPLNAAPTPLWDTPLTVAALSAGAALAPTDEGFPRPRGVNARGPSLRKAEATFGKLDTLAVWVSRCAEPGVPL